MGCDVHIVLGRINLEAVQKRIAAPVTTTSESTAIALFGKGVEAEDFELDDVPEEYELNRNYALFSWLGVVGRGKLRPYYQGDDRQEKTRAFLDWLDTKLLESSAAEDNAVGFSWGQSESSILDKYDLGDHSRIIFTVNTLANFNYDDVVELDDGTNRNNPIYYRDPEGETYRKFFGEAYFKFLEFSQRESWHFVIFGFDN